LIKAIVTDIEGTTSSLSFVKDVLFPYARKNIGDYIRRHADDGKMIQLVNDVRREAGENLDLQGVVDQLEKWIDEDKKITPLKTLQGLLWETGYRQGDFQGHIYDDAKEALELWHQQGIRLYVYSSGSVYAQKLLFGYTAYGDLTSLFDGYFDTHIGAKVESDSYRNIVKAIGIDADKILFLSDIEAELDAAREAGLKTYWLVRDAEPNVHASHQQVRNFTTIQLT
jgi:enolase-phosphatase E1